MSTAAVGIPSLSQEDAKLYPSLELKRKFFTDLRCGDIFSFWCEGGSRSTAPKYVKVSGNSMLLVTGDVCGLNKDQQKDVLWISSVQGNSPVYHETRMPPDYYRHLIGQYLKLETEAQGKTGEKTQPTAT